MANDLYDFGIDMNDPSTWHIDVETLTDHQRDRLASTKRWFGRYLGEEFADIAESIMTTERGNPTKKRKLKVGNKSARDNFHSRICPIIAGRGTKSFYDDPRDNLPSDLRDQDDSIRAEHCCDRCQLMTGTAEGLSVLVSPKGYQHFTCDQVRKEADISGCAFCELVRGMMAHCKICCQSALQEGVIRIWAVSEDDGVADIHPFRPGPRLKALKVQIPLDPMRNLESDSHHDHELGVLAFQESPVARYVIGRRPDKTLTPEFILQLRTWLRDCQDGNDGHKSCPRRCLPLLPTRVLDIGDESCSTIRLHINNSELRGQYAALSYCWGGDQPYKTTTANHASYTQELDPAVFPKTLHDAFRVCRVIGIRYVWIDALCIVQDDMEDKAREICQMGKIYKNATVTIMAGSAESAYAGFLDETKVDAPEAKLPFYLGRDSFGAVYVRHSFGTRPYFLDEEPIFKRAWTLQEMLLSSRIIVFDSYQATFKCGRMEFWPVLPTYIHPELRLSSILDSNYHTFKEFHLETLARKYQEQPSVLKEQDAEGHSLKTCQFSTQCRMWAAIMAEYSRRDLSVLDDRYPALAGVTRELQKIWGGEFIAGFWTNSLVQHLGWVGGIAADEQYAGKRWERRLDGPSWSWMSHPSSVHVDPVAITDVKVLGCEVELAFPDQPFGPVKWGSLALEARTLPLSALKTRVRPNSNAVWKTALAILPVAVDGIALDFPSRGLPEGELKAMVLGMPFSSRDNFCVTFLVLRRLEGDTYERVGQAVLNLEYSMDDGKSVMDQAKREVIVIE